MLILLPFFILIIAFITVFFLKNTNAIWITNIVFSVFTFLSVLLLFCSIYYFTEENIYIQFTKVSRIDLIDILIGLKLSFMIDRINITFAIMVTALNVVANLYSVGYMKANNLSNQSNFFAFFNLSIFSTLGIAFSENLLTMFIFYEMLTLCTYPLVIYNHDQKSYDAGSKYLVMLISTSTLMLLPAIVLTYNFGNGNFTETLTDFPKFMSVLIFLLFNFGVAKSALVPFHGWLISAMVAPAPVSALLHAVAVVKSGIFFLLKVYVFVFLLKDKSLGMLLTIISGATIIFASICAFKAKEIKQMLAYSTISQLSYILITASLFTINAIKIAMFYILAHAFAKITLFFCAGLIYTQTNKKYINEMNGVFKKMPVTGLCFIVGAFAMIGLPPTTIFYAKHYIFVESVTLNNYLIPFILVLSASLSSIYYLKVIHTGFFKTTNECFTKKTNCLMIISTIFTSLVTILLPIFTQDIIDFFIINLNNMPNMH